ncbi:unnamed protein product [Cuscuta epithymum]|uniref:Protein kinase domain-containing protein n=2 Tax=Cuscuta epithymum TaxID=186058 RepID=A0AAV0G9B3_9ASTE|nr:unnamed protein product [Cuscuta epithymum]
MATEQEKFNFLSALRAVDCIASPFLTTMKYDNRWVKLNYTRSTRDPIIGIDLGEVKHVSRFELEDMTDDFNPKNIVARGVRGRLFKGVMTQGSETREVTVKTWDFSPPLNIRDMNCYSDALAGELLLLTTPDISSHPSLVKLIGYSVQDWLAVVFDFKWNQTLQDLIPCGSFSLEQRMNVAIDLAQAIEHLHDRQIALGNLSASNVSIDQEYKVKLFNFDCHLNPRFPRRYINALKTGDPIHYTDCEKKNALALDVYAYGVLLKELIAQKLGCAKEVTDGRTYSYVEQSLLGLGQRCMEYAVDCRPSIHDVVASLRQLLPTRKRKYRSTSSPSDDEDDDESMELC